jgi:hypothetical protein
VLDVRAAKGYLAAWLGVVEDCRFRVAEMLCGLMFAVRAPAIDRSGILCSFCVLCKR